ncbi:MAG: hypothetical protein M1828_001989 [Chrysothrix sp. TS-e1954]|nr:MAG: hypothetical protein M1828_001989 [Chrysothrix sp. TS-e1954]
MNNNDTKRDQPQMSLASTRPESLSSYDPPPSYGDDSNHASASAHEDIYPNEKKIDSMLSREEPPPFPGDSQAPTRTLHIYFENWLWRQANILDSDKTSVVYSVDCRLRRPQVTVRTPDRSIIGTAGFHLHTMRIDTFVHDFNVSLKSLGLITDGYVYSSNARRDETITWKSLSWNCFHLLCVDQAGKPLARFLFGKWSIKKGGTIELLDPSCAKDGPMMDEIIITGLTVIQARMMTYGMTL